mmetsp:Transcript_26012/g.38799  ORF Transcript_26012/g.38799 Transcript_26012/m.38799 type:complete len:363 (+) Transcript_26012:261-1349(+)
MFSSVSTQEPDSFDLKNGILTSKHVHNTKCPLTNLISTLLETTNGITGHENTLVILVVVVILVPERPSLLIEFGPEVLHGSLISSSIGVCLLPCIHAERTGCLTVHNLVGMLRLLLRSRGGSSFLLLVLLTTTGLLLSLLLLLTRGTCLLLTELNLTNDLLELLLVDTGVEPAGDVGEGLEETLIADELHRVHQSTDDTDIGKGDGIPNEVGTGMQMTLQLGQYGSKVLLALGVGLLAKGHVSCHGVPPYSGGKLELVHAKVHPAVHGGGLVHIISSQGGISTSNTGNMAGNGVAFPDSSLGGGEDGGLAEGAECEDVAEVIAGLNVDTAVFGGDEGLEGTEVTGRSVEGVHLLAALGLAFG